MTRAPQRQRSMKKIYTSRNLTHCDMIRSFLEANGISSVMKNELSCYTAGASIVGGLAFAWPEVWVNDEDMQTAEETLKDSGFSFLCQDK